MLFNMSFAHFSGNGWREGNEGSGIKKMLMLTVKLIPDGYEGELNLETIAFVRPGKDEKGKETDKTCIVQLTSGLIMHINKGRKEVVGMMKNYRS